MEAGQASRQRCTTGSSVLSAFCPVREAAVVTRTGWSERPGGREVWRFCGLSLGATAT